MVTTANHVIAPAGRGGVEDTMLEAKAKDQGHKRKCSPKKKRSSKFFSGDLKNKVVFKKIFQAIFTKNGLEKHFSANLQTFNHSKNSAVLEPRTGQFSRPQGQGRPGGLHLCRPDLHCAGS